MSSKFTIPEKFRSDVRLVESKDARSDEEILESLMKFVPMKYGSEKNIWTFWHSGFKSMPSWCQRNIFNWIRLCGPSWTVRVLDSIPGSPNNALKWAESTEIKLPQTFVKGTMDGPYAGPHSADFLRRACLSLLTGQSTSFQVSAVLMHTTIMANQFVASRKHNRFIKRWHNIFNHMWEGQTNSANIIQHPLANIGQTIDYEQQEARGFRWEFILEPQFVAGYVSQVLAWLRLSALEEPNGFSRRDYHAEKILYFDALDEDWEPKPCGLSRPKSVGGEGGEKTEEYKLAYKNAWRILTKSSMQKITHGKNLTKTPALGVLWLQEENEEKDIEPGTFAELLRYGSVHLEQTRETIVYVKGERPGLVIKKGLLEP